MAIIEEIIASVEPQQTVISRSGSIATPCVRSNFAAMASRTFCAPGDGVLIDVRGNGLLRGVLDFGRARGNLEIPASNLRRRNAAPGASFRGSPIR